MGSKNPQQQDKVLSLKWGVNIQQQQDNVLSLTWGVRIQQQQDKVLSLTWGVRIQQQQDKVLALTWRVRIQQQQDHHMRTGGASTGFLGRGFICIKVLEFALLIFSFFLNIQ